MGKVEINKSNSDNTVLQPVKVKFNFYFYKLNNDLFMVLTTVRGYSQATGGPGSDLLDSNIEQDTIRELSQRKQVIFSSVLSAFLSVFCG